MCCRFPPVSSEWNSVHTQLSGSLSHSRDISLAVEINRSATALIQSKVGADTKCLCFVFVSPPPTPQPTPVVFLEQGRPGKDGIPGYEVSRWNTFQTSLNALRIGPQLHSRFVSPPPLATASKECIKHICMFEHFTIRPK